MAACTFADLAAAVEPASTFVGLAGLVVLAAAEEPASTSADLAVLAAGTSWAAGCRRR